MTLRFVVGPQRIERSRTDILLMIRHITPFTTDSICVANDSVVVVLLLQRYLNGSCVIR